MSTACEPLILYLELARAAELRRRPFERDRLLVLAAVAASRSGQESLAAFCRHKVLSSNPGHALAKSFDVASALREESFRRVLSRLERAFPRERAEHMLRSLGIEPKAEGVAYRNDFEHAAALLGMTPDTLDHWYGEHVVETSQDYASDVVDPSEDVDDDFLDEDDEPSDIDTVIEDEPQATLAVDRTSRWALYGWCGLFLIVGLLILGLVALWR